MFKFKRQVFHKILLVCASGKNENYCERNKLSMIYWNRKWKLKTENAILNLTEVRTEI